MMKSKIILWVVLGISLQNVWGAAHDNNLVNEVFSHYIPPSSTLQPRETEERHRAYQELGRIQDREHQEWILQKMQTYCVRNDLSFSWLTVLKALLSTYQTAQSRDWFERMVELFYEPESRNIHFREQKKYNQSSGFRDLFLIPINERQSALKILELVAQHNPTPQEPRERLYFTPQTQLKTWLHFLGAICGKLPPYKWRRLESLVQETARQLGPDQPLEFSFPPLKDSLRANHIYPNAG